MIKYLELTAPEKSQFRQAKISAVAINEGDRVAAGDVLFKVISGDNEYDLPSRLPGKIVEIIVDVGESISLMTPLVLIETEVKKSTASKPIVDDDNAESRAKTKKSKRKTKNKGNSKSKKKRKAKKHYQRGEQQDLNLDGNEVSPASMTDKPNQPHHRNQHAESSRMSELKISVPDIGIDSATVIEVLVSVGDSLSIDDPIVTIESDKASMDVPSTAEGVVKEILTAVGQDVSEGDVLISLSSANDNQTSEAPAETATTEVAAPAEETPKVDAPVDAPVQTSTSEVRIPDIGGDAAKVIEIFVKVGQSVEVEDPLVTLESDKASMDVPSTAAGTIESIDVSLDQEVSEGTLVVTISGGATMTSSQADTPAPATASTPTPTAAASPQATAPKAAPESPAPVSPTATSPNTTSSKSHSSPSVRRFARELGANLDLIQGTGRKGRITKDDVKKFVKGEMTKPSGAATISTEGAGIPAVPAVDFSKFGEIDIQPLNKIKKLTAANLHRSWLNVPHVTHHDESNISDLEDFRAQLNKEYQKQGKETKLSPLAFIVKAVVSALKAYPQFNASLEPGGDNLIFKKYFHIGIAVETPNGLVVPVIRDADKKTLAEIADEMGDLAGKARNKKLTPADMSGSCFTISSLGGIGGTKFTPIVNAPEVAILGVSRTKVEPLWNGSEFVPAKMLPLSLSYDHRVIDGAEAARFTRHIASILDDLRRLAV